MERPSIRWPSLPVSVSPPPEAQKNGAQRPGESLIAALGLAPHPEGGWYRRTWVAEAADGARPAGSAIYYLLLQGELLWRPTGWMPPSCGTSTTATHSN